TWTARPFNSDSFKRWSSEIDAEYQYQLDEDTDERIFNGFFKGFQKLDLKNKNGVPFISSIDISGNFVDDQQDGVWVYDYVYSDTKIKCTLSFNKGLLNGRQIAEISTKEKTLKWWMDFKDGHYSGEIGVESNVGTEGKYFFTDDGRPTGNWELLMGHDLHKISFDENGKVTKARTIDNRNGEVTQWYEIDETDKIVSNALSKTDYCYLPILDGGYNNPLGGENININIFSLLHPMRKTRVYADNPINFSQTRTNSFTINGADLKKNNDTEDASDEIFTVVDDEAHFLGGYAAMLLWVDENIEASMDCRVIVAFDVMKDGSIKNVEIVKGVDRNTDKAVKEAFLSDAMPAWKPAIKDGKKVNSRKSVTLRLHKPRKKK
ncbi:MAG: energy transducer TonB, partial [Muribaculaceae bacterium]|nr:energy transducer TonB [Muribaculaceae bacterium]